MLRRVDRVRERLAAHNLDALLVSSPTNIRYLFGFTGSNAIALITSDPCFFITDRRYAQQSQQQVTQASICIAQNDLFAELANIPFIRPGMRIGIEAAYLTVKQYNALRKQFPNVKLLASERIVEGIASVKDADEIASIRKAADICKRVFEEVYSLLKPGISELEISAEISYRTRRLGSEKDAFEPIVASGRRSALPHGISSQKTISAAELVIIDFGAVVNGYAADLTRTVVVGKMTEKQRHLARAVLDALTHAESAAKPGMTGWQLDAVARDTLKGHGLGEYFQHSLGHGLGLNVHELPRLGETSQDVLQPGQVFTLEPGVYLPDVGGVRIEDDFLMTKHGVENLSAFNREVVCV